jgi:hypothetical protein
VEDEDAEEETQGCLSAERLAGALAVERVGRPLPCEMRTAEAFLTPPDQRDTSAPFSKEEIALIKQAILTPGAMVECPRCGTLLKIDTHPAMEEHKLKVLWVFCETCKRNLIVRDVPTDSAGS